MAKLTYEIEMTPTNASKIDAINKILLGESYTEEAPAKKSAKTTSEPSASSKSTDTQESSTSTVSLEDVKNAAKKAKSEFGEEFAMKVLKDAGVDVKTTLGRSMAAIDEELYESVIASWTAGPQESEDNLEDDDDFGDDDLDEDEGDVDADAVKTALKAYSKEHGRDKAKEVMSNHKVKALSGVDDLSGAALAKLMKDLV